MKKIFILILILVSSFSCIYSATDDEIINQTISLQTVSGADDLISELQDLVQKFVNDPKDYGGIGVNFTSCKTQIINFRGSVTSVLAMCIPLMPGSVNDPQTLRGKLAQRLSLEMDNYLLNNSYWEWERYTTTPTPHINISNPNCKIAWDHSSGGGPAWEKMYAIWAYAYWTGDWNKISNNWTFIKNKYNSLNKTPGTGQRACIVAHYPCDTTNCYIMSNYRIASNDLANGLIGYTRMAEHFGDSTRTQARTEAKSALADVTNRVNVSWASFPLADGGTARGDWTPGYNLTPELGRWINENTTARNYAQTRLDEAANSGLLKGHWWCGFLNNYSKGNSNFQNEDAWGLPALSGELFLGRAWMLQESAQVLRAVKPWHTVMGDIPEYRDILYIRCLYALITRHATVNWVQAY